MGFRVKAGQSMGCASCCSMQLKSATVRPDCYCNLHKNCPPSLVNSFENSFVGAAPRSLAVLC
eukprot:908686-Amphidinium_carterae.1